MLLSRSVAIVKNNIQHRMIPGSFDGNPSRLDIYIYIYIFWDGRISSVLGDIR